MNQLPPEVSIQLSVLAGNFSICQEHQIGLLRRTGKDFAILQFPENPEYKAFKILGSSSDFDLALINVCEVAQGVKRSDNGVKVSHIDSSVFVALRNDMGSMVRLNIEKKEAELRTSRLKADTDFLRSKEKQENAETDFQLAKAGLKSAENANKESSKIVEELKQFMESCKKHFGLTPETPIIEVMQHMTKVVKKGNEFENMLDKLSEKE